MRWGQILDFSSFRVSPESPMFGPARISRARVHVPLAGVLRQVLRQGGHHDLDPQTPNSIADVPDARARAPPRASEVLDDLLRDGVDFFSGRHRLPATRARGDLARCGWKKKTERCPVRLDGSGCDGARMVEAERVSGQRDGSVTEAARMKPSARARRACGAWPSRTRWASSRKRHRWKRSRARARWRGRARPKTDA